MKKVEEIKKMVLLANWVQCRWWWWGGESWRRWKEGDSVSVFEGYSRMKSEEERRAPGFDEKNWVWPNSALYWVVYAKIRGGNSNTYKIAFFYLIL